MPVSTAVACKFLDLVFQNLMHLHDTKVLMATLGAPSYMHSRSGTVALSQSGLHSSAELHWSERSELTTAGLRATWPHSSTDWHSEWCYWSGLQCCNAGRYSGLGCALSSSNLSQSSSFFRPTSSSLRSALTHPT